ncbi:MAG TPA: outer membrane protein assembly factor BamE [Prosthecobacter sp.]|nr:outer membrane protein assembly factor BamE [Prosthecobacter sp.]
MKLSVLVVHSLLLTLAACSSSLPTPAMKIGMTKQEVRTLYGEPLRIERQRGGGESWHYQMRVTRSEPRPFTTGSAEYEPYKREPSTYTSSAGIEWGDTSQEHSASVDFNAQGRVEAVPNGVPIPQ